MTFSHPVFKRAASLSVILRIQRLLAGRLGAAPFFLYN